MVCLQPAHKHIFIGRKCKVWDKSCFKVRLRLINGDTWGMGRAPVRVAPAAEAY